MSLFSSQTIFCILFSLLIGFGLYYYIKIKYRVLEISQCEQAKVLQSVIMTMNTNNHNIMSIVQNRDQDENISGGTQQDMNKIHQVDSTSELIDVSDDSESESSDDESSDSGSDSSESSDSDGDEIDEGSDSNKRKILFTNGESQNVEHLEGPDVKVIELTHPLYSNNSNGSGNNNCENDCDNDDDDDDDDDDNDGDDDDDDDDDDKESDSESVPSEIDGPHQPIEGFEIHDIHDIHEIHEIKENDIVLDSNQSQHVDIETDSITEVTSVDNSLDNLSVKTVFKIKDSEIHPDYNTMNVQSLRQLLKNKLTSDGSSVSESSIHKLTKKELIKQLS